MTLAEAITATKAFNEWISKNGNNPEKWREYLVNGLWQTFPGCSRLIFPEETKKKVLEGPKVGTPIVVHVKVDESFAIVDTVVHGGFLAYVADATMSLAGLAMCKPSQIMSTIEMKINFLSPTFVSQKLIIAEATVLSIGSSTCVIKCDVKTGNKLVATALATFNFFERKIKANL